MYDTEDLPSYIPGYEEYITPKEEEPDFDDIVDRVTDDIMLQQLENRKDSD